MDKIEVHLGYDNSNTVEQLSIAYIALQGLLESTAADWVICTCPSNDNYYACYMRANGGKWIKVD